MRVLFTMLMVTYLLWLNSHIFAEETDIPKSQIIAEFDEDMTGDQIKEHIILKGIPFSENTAYYRDIWIEVSNLYGHEWRISYEGGYDPSIQFIDLNQDGVVDVFYQSGTESNSGPFQYHFHTLKNNKVKALPLPTQYYIKGKFVDQYKVEIRISPDQKPIEIDIADQMDQYDQYNIYDQHGKILTQKSLSIPPIAYFEPVLISRNKGYGLKSSQHINGTSQSHRLGTVETLWYYNYDQWIILKTEWFEHDT